MDELPVNFVISNSSKMNTDLLLPKDSLGYTTTELVPSTQSIIAPKLNDHVYTSKLESRKSTGVMPVKPLTNTTRKPCRLQQSSSTVKLFSAPSGGVSLTDDTVKEQLNSVKISAFKSN